jgi:WD40 repeat protein
LAVSDLVFDPHAEEWWASSIDGTIEVISPKDARRRVLYRHDAAVWGMARSDSGRSLALATSDGVYLRAIDVDDKTTFPKEGHDAAVIDAAFSRDAKHVVSAGVDGTIRMWAVESGEEVLQRRVDGGAARAVAFRPDGRKLVSADGYGGLITWDVATMAPLVRYGGTGASSGGRVERLRYLADDRVVTIDLSGKIVEWDAVSGIPQRSRQVSNSRGGLAISPSGDSIAIGSGALVELWQDEHKTRALAGHGGNVSAVAFIADGKWLGSGDSAGQVRLWDLDTDQSRIVHESGGRIYSMATHPNERELAWASSNRRAYLYDVTRGAIVELAGHAGEVNSIAYDSSGQFVVTASDDGTVRVWRRDGRPHWHAPATIDRGARLLTTIGGWKSFGGEPVTAQSSWERAIAATSRFAVENDDRTLACSLTDGDGFEMWQTRGDTRLRHITGSFADAVALRHGCAARAADRIVMLSASGHHELPLSDGVTAIGSDGEVLLAASTKEALTIDVDARVLERHPVGGGATAIARVDSRRLAVGYREGGLELVPVAAGAAGVRLESIASSPVTRIVIGPRETLIAGYANGTIGMWNTRDGEVLARARLHGPVAHLVMDAGRMRAVSLLGRKLSWDLRVLDQQRCELLRDIWNQVPMGWEDGRAVERTAPSGHACSPGAAR